MTLVIKKISIWGYLTSDLQVVTKYVGVRMQIPEHIGDSKTAQTVLQSYQHIMYDFLTKPVIKKVCQQQI